MSVPSVDQMNEFMRLLVGNQRRLYQYVHALLPSEQDVEDALQETFIVLWKKFEQFQPGSSFFAWASRVAYLEVLALRKRRGGGVVILDDEVLELLAGEAIDAAPLVDARHRALADCMNKLPAADRELVERRYALGTRRNDLARELGRPANSVSKSLGRIRQALWDCIHRALADDEEQHGANS
jgi:RNA polymerase sigma-70 factor (ECF subfamily)